MSRPASIFIPEFGSLRSYPDPADIPDTDFTDERNTARDKLGVLQRRKGWTPVLRTEHTVCINGIFDYVDYEGRVHTVVQTCDGTLQRAQKDPGVMWTTYTSDAVHASACCYNEDNDEIAIVHSTTGGALYLTIRSSDGLTEVLAATQIAASIYVGVGQRDLAIDWDGSNYGILYNHVSEITACFVSVSRAGAIVAGPTSLGVNTRSTNFELRWNGTHFGACYNQVGAGNLSAFIRLNTSGVGVGAEITFTGSTHNYGMGCDTDATGWMVVYSGTSTLAYAEYVGSDGVSDGRVALSQLSGGDIDFANYYSCKWNGQHFGCSFGEYFIRVDPLVYLVGGLEESDHDIGTLARRGDGWASLVESSTYISDLRDAEGAILANGSTGLARLTGYWTGTVDGGDVCAVVGGGQLGIFKV